MSSRHARKSKPMVTRIDDRLSLSFDELRVQSEMRMDAPDELVLGYTRTMMGFLLFRPRPARIAMIGLGGGSLLKYCYASLPETSITVAEIDPEVIALRERFLIPADDARLRVLCDDGANFVSDKRHRYDVLIVDGYTERGQPASLGTQRFYNDCYDCLTDNGVLVVNMSDLAVGFEPLVARIRHSFSNSVIIVDAEDSTNNIVFAGKGSVLGISYDELLTRLTELEAHLPIKLYRTAQAIRDAREHEPA